MRRSLRSSLCTLFAPNHVQSDEWNAGGGRRRLAGTCNNKHASRHGRLSKLAGPMSQRGLPGGGCRAA